VAAAVIAAVAYAIGDALGDPSPIQRAFGIAIATLPGLAAYALCLLLLRVRETGQLIGLIRRPRPEAAV
jgi:hypothetical protein